MWNAFMTNEAIFGKHDIPFCPTTTSRIPKDQVTWEEAKLIHKKHILRGEKNYYEDLFINWYIDDYKFDGPKGIWNNYDASLNIIIHFAGIITPDFSTYQDFPLPIKLYATYRMRAYGYWLGRQGINVINNVRWGTKETFDFTFEGIQKNSIVSIGTVGGGPRKLIDRERFEIGLYKMVEVLKPNTILVYGSMRGACFERLKREGISIIGYQGKTAKYFERSKKHE